MRHRVCRSAPVEALHLDGGNDRPHGPWTDGDVEFDRALAVSVRLGQMLDAFLVGSGAIDGMAAAHES